MIKRQLQKSLSNQGFGLIGVLFVLAGVLIIGLGGWLIYRNGHKSTPVINKAITQPKANTSRSKISSTPGPTLGIIWSAYQQGYGVVQPTTINNGGDPTGIVTNVTWQSWGGSRATGQGTSTYVAPNETTSQGTQAQATIVAFNLSTCHGQSAYTAIEWYFPQYGGSFNPNQYRNICTGNAVGE